MTFTANVYCIGIDIENLGINGLNLQISYSFFI